MSYKSVPQKCPRRVSHKSLLQRVSHKSFLQECHLDICSFSIVLAFGFVGSILFGGCIFRSLRRCRVFTLDDLYWLFAASYSLRWPSNRRSAVKNRIFDSAWLGGILLEVWDSKGPRLASGGVTEYGPTLSQAAGILTTLYG